MSNVYARVSNGYVREVIYNDPAGDYVPSITWVQVSNSTTTGANITGDTYAVQPRWSYDGSMFNPPVAQIALPKPSGHARYQDEFAMVGQGANVWIEISNVSIIADLKTAHFLSYSTDVYDHNLYSYSTQIIIGGAVSNTPGGNQDFGTAADIAAASGANAADIAAAKLADLIALGSGILNSGSGILNGSSGETGGTPDPNSPEPLDGTCFVGSTPILMRTGSTKPISHLVIGDSLQSDNGGVIVLDIYKKTAQVILVSFNGLPHFVTTNHAMLTDKGWGAFDPTLFAATEPAAYLQVCADNNYKPLLTLTQGCNLAYWINGNKQYTPIENVSFISSVQEVFWLHVSGDNHYIANSIIVHNIK